MTDDRRWVLKRSTAHGVRVDYAPDDGTYGIPWDEQVTVVPEAEVERAVAAERQRLLADILAFVRGENVWTSPETMAVLLQRKFGAPGG